MDLTLAADPLTTLMPVECKLTRMPWTRVLLPLVLSLSLSSMIAGQTLVTGSIQGTVRYPTHSIVQGAEVELLSLATGQTHSTTTNGEGEYRFPLLPPGRYEVYVSVQGLDKRVVAATVNVGQTTSVDIALQLTRRNERIDVSGLSSSIGIDPGRAITFTPLELDLLPASGEDITTIAFTAPATVLAPGGGVGNFSVNGLPATSNSFTINGEDSVEPYSNVNISGASNLSLGKNEVEAVTIVTNPYSAEYGQFSGAQINYVTKSGTNQFHGNEQWWWNGSSLNSNNFLSDATSTPKPFSNANQWAASIGGPIRKNHTWFFLNTEGIRFVLPNVYFETIPTSAFAAPVLENVRDLHPAEASAYQQIFRIYANAASGKTTTPLPAAGTDCETIVLPGFIAGVPCAETLVTTRNSFTREWTLASRVDHKITEGDDVFVRFELDRGVQASYIDPLNAAFDAHSNQPIWDTQIQYRHAFNANSVNLFTAATSYYSFFLSQNLAEWQAAFPNGGVQFQFPNGFSGINSLVGNLPSGRKVTQYQFIDDYAWLRGKHNLKFGVNFRRYDVTDHTSFSSFPTTQFGALTAGAGTTGIQAFADGVANTYIQQYHASPDVPIAVWGAAFYAEDAWKITSTLTLTGALRLEKNSNPVCQTNCFSNFKTSFPNLVSVQAGLQTAPDVPYDKDININLHHAFMGADSMNWSPRLAFAWMPGSPKHSPWLRGGGKTLVSGGLGIFYDTPSTGLVDALLTNPPSAETFFISPLNANFETTGILPFDPEEGGPAAFAAASRSFSLTKSFNQLSAALNPILGFTPPLTFTSIQGKLRTPQVQEWNLKFDEQLAPSTVLTLNYVGNHSVFLIYSNSWWNATATDRLFANLPGLLPAPYPNYGPIYTLQNGGVANYNGLTISLREQYHNWFSGHINFTYSHALDDVSNGGFYGFSYGSLQFQMNPITLRANDYGNADYDVRHLFNGDFVITPPLHLQSGLLRFVLDGWQWSGKAYARSGLAYTVLDGRADGSIANGGGPIVAQIVAASHSSTCTSAAAYVNSHPLPCVTDAAFLNTSSPTFPGYTKYPNETRNQFYGPSYIDFDFGLFKTFRVREKISFGLGAQVSNVFNHPNFGLPDANLGDSTFGLITSMQGVPASPYGNGLGFDSSVRVVQLSAKLNF
jgi:Carboxypeptidase regulatory-like domain